VCRQASGQQDFAFCGSQTVNPTVTMRAMRRGTIRVICPRRCSTAAMSISAVGYTAETHSQGQYTTGLGQICGTAEIQELQTV